FLIQVPSLVRRGMKFTFGISFSHPAIRDVARLMLPRLFGIGIGQINLLIDTRFATAARMPPGSLAALYVADRVMELVLGGYAIAVATAILPMMSHQAAAKDYDSLKKTLSFSVRIVAFITIPAALGLMILREPIIRVLFQHGQFVAESTRLTARWERWIFSVRLQKFPCAPELWVSPAGLGIITRGSPCTRASWCNFLFLLL